MAYVFREGRENAAVICQRCGFKKHANELHREWTGLRVCSDCWEPRHPQEFVRGIADRQQVPGGALPEPADVFDVSYLLHEDGSPFFREFASGSSAIRRES